MDGWTDLVGFIDAAGRECDRRTPAVDYAQIQRELDGLRVYWLRPTFDGPVKDVRAHVIADLKAVNDLAVMRGDRAMTPAEMEDEAERVEAWVLGLTESEWAELVGRAIGPAPDAVYRMTDEELTRSAGPMVEQQIDRMALTRPRAQE